ncbi:DUF502 domain-containing protein [Chamaesiphon sp. GL140_3_metabinner_50]|uniref:DUF502 domain-containing protein n=1 Tax=Chamaesiphon sp. GL140_3_metabinner_50 TaxID=2970812 RepID=UPI0026005DC7|nr:DUF502 domain-containing protein [Chamaesiphon sp. GL140_3_metabinner_50]
MFQHFKQDLKNDLIAGLLVVIPLATTLWLSINVTTWVVNFLTRIPKQIAPFEGLDPILVYFLNLLVGLAAPLLIILTIGLMARNFAGKWLLDIGERLLQAIPLAGAVYKTLKQLLETLLRDSGNKFRRVVLVEYPRRGIWALAFVTGTLDSEIQSQMPQGMLNLFIPTTPNPTTGWYAVVAETEVLDLAMSIEDAFKVVISGGIVNPGNVAVAALSQTSDPIVVAPVATGLPVPIIDSPEERAFRQREDNSSS